MKSKNLLLALALPVALTACTADDFMTDQSENPTVAGRKVVGNVTFVAPEGADTRTIWNDEDKKLDWTDTDVLGAALMDKLKENLTTEEGAAKYEIVNQLYSNYRYDYKNGEFTNNNATFVEGNYFVYAQFKAKQGREGLAYSISAVQEVGKDGRGAWYENQMFLDHIFVKEGDSKVAVNPLPVFPLVTLNTTYEGDDANVVIKKIVISDAGNGFGNVGTVKPATSSTAEYNALANMGATMGTGGDENDYKVAAGGTLDALFTAYKNAKEDFGKEYTVAAGKTKDDIVNPNLYEYFVAGNTKSASLTLEYTGSKQSEVGVMVVPQQKSTDRTATDLKIEIYTNKGLVTIAGNGSGDMSNAFTLSSAKEYNTKQNATSLKDKAENAIAFDSKKNADDKTTYAMPFLSDLTAGQISRFYIKFKDDAILVPSEVTVTTTGELKDYLTNWYAGKKDKIIGGNNNTVIVNAAPEEGKKVEVDNDVLAFMANTAANPVLKFKGTITIPVGTSADALDKITKASEDLAIINEASLTWKDNNKTFTTITNKGTLVVGENAGDVKEFTAGIANLGTLTVKGSVGIVTNGSSVEPVNAAAEITLARGIVASLTNSAVATVSGDATVTALTNNKTLIVNAGATLETGANSINKGTITVAAGENASYEHGGNWNVNGDFINHAEVVNNDNVKANIVNGGKITVKQGTFTNGVNGVVIEKNATITNNGQIACADDGTNKGTFNNEGYMEVNAETVTLITENKATAEILVNDGSAQINVPTTPGKITYIVNSQTALNSIPNSVNSLRVVASSIDLTGLDNKTNSGKIKYLEFRSNQTMTIKCVEDKSEFANVIFNGDNATAKVQFTVNGKLKATEKFEVKANARVTINNEIEFANATATNYTNQGTLLIIGKLNFSGIQKADKGTVTLGEIYFSGGDADTNIIWKN